MSGEETPLLSQVAGTESINQESDQDGHSDRPHVNVHFGSFYGTSDLDVNRGCLERVCLLDLLPPFSEVYCFITPINGHCL